MRIYHYDSDTRILLGAGVADQDQLATEETPEAERWIHPAHSTTVAPPTAPPGKAAQFNVEAGTWSLVAVRPPMGDETSPVPETDDERVARLAAEEKAVARAYLAATDWYVIRQLEKKKKMPAEISAMRDTARETLSK